MKIVEDSNKHHWKLDTFERKFRFDQNLCFSVVFDYCAGLCIVPRFNIKESFILFWHYCFCSLSDALTIQLLFDQCWVGVGSYKLKMCYFQSNAQQHFEVVCHKWNYLSCIQKLPKLQLFLVCQFLKATNKTLPKIIKFFEQS